MAGVGQGRAAAMLQHVRIGTVRFYGSGLFRNKIGRRTFKESKRASSASAANRRTHVYIRETVYNADCQNQTNRPHGGDKDSRLCRTTVTRTGGWHN